MRVCLKSKGYRIIPHTSEVGVGIRGRSWPQFYRNAASGLLAVYEPSGKPAKLSWIAKTILADAPEEALVCWLNELIYLISARRWLPLRVRIRHADERGLRAELAGGRLGKTVRVGKEIKSATYHRLSVCRRRGFWRAEVILDV